MLPKKDKTATEFVDDPKKLQIIRSGSLQSTNCTSKNVEDNAISSSCEAFDSRKSYEQKQDKKENEISTRMEHAKQKAFSQESASILRPAGHNTKAAKLLN